MKKSKEDYIFYRIEKANEAISDCKLLAENKRWNLCMNRLYYSVFYMVSALLLKHNLTIHTHNGTKTKFFSEFVKKGLIDKKFSKLYSDLFDWRQENDYVDFIDIDEESVIPKLKEVQNFFIEIEKPINS